MFTSAAALPPTLVEAIRQLASDNDLQEIRTKVYERITEIDNESDVIDLPNGEFVNIEWSEGTEDFQASTRDEIAAALGLVNGEIPNFNAFLDPRGEKTYWDHAEWFADAANDQIPCSPRWHQLVGQLAMVHRAFDGKNVLLMDEVGLGKTMQIVGVIAILTFFREYHEAKGHFPGAFSECRIFGVFRDCFSHSRAATEDRQWHNKPGNIPDLPSIIVVPKSLHPQFTRELRRYLLPHSFDILPYLGRVETRKDFWSTIWTKSKHALSRRILLATTGVSIFGHIPILEMSTHVDME